MIHSQSKRLDSSENHASSQPPPSLLRSLPSAQFGGYVNMGRNLWKQVTIDFGRKPSDRHSLPTNIYRALSVCLSVPGASAVWMGGGDGSGGQSTVCRRLPAFVNQVVLEQGHTYLFTYCLFWCFGGVVVRDLATRRKH